LKGAKDAIEATQALFRNGCSGDPETYLSVYEEWVDNECSSEWCDEEKVNSRALEEADALLAKVHKALQRQEIPILDTLDRGSQERSAASLTALMVAFPDNVAVANDPTAVKEGFRQVSTFQTAPTVLHVHPSSVIKKTEAGVDMILFLSRRVARGGMNMQLALVVSSVSQDLVLQAAQMNIGTGQVLEDFKEQLQAMKHVSKDFVADKCREHEVSLLSDCRAARN
jgi:hypothetical protein